MVHSGGMKHLVLITAVALSSLTLAAGGHAQEAGSIEEERLHAPGDIDVDADNQLARRAVKQGDAAPLESIMVKAKPLLKGDLVGIKLEQHFGVWMYEFRVVDPKGHMQYIHVDAKTGVYLAVGAHPCESC